LIKILVIVLALVIGYLSLPERHKCKICGRAFRTYLQLTFHESHHTPDQVREYNKEEFVESLEV